MPTAAKTKEMAHKALDGMAQITKREMLIRGEYVSDNVDKKLAEEGAICGGHRACAIGSLYIGYGIPLTEHNWEDDDNPSYSLPGVDPASRKAFTRNRPGLRLAMKALDHVAEKRTAGLSKRQQENVEEFLYEHDDDAYGIKIEALFEGVTRGPSRLNRENMLEVISEAKKYVDAA